MRDNVARIRRLLDEATERRPTESSYEREMKNEYSFYALNDPGPLIVQTPRDRAEREVIRLAGWYGWQSIVERRLDDAQAASIGGLSDAEVHALRDELRQLEECVQHGLGAPNAPPPA